MNELIVFDNTFILKNRVNFKLAEEKNLIKDKDCRVYALIQSLYLKVFEEFISSKVDLKKYDYEIKNSGLDFGLVPEDRKIPSQKISSLNLNYIYFRNFFFIEKLENKYLSVFWDKIKNNNYSVSAELTEIVEKTYRDVIVDNFVMGEYKDLITISYGQATPSNFANSNQLALVIQYGLNSSNFNEEEYMDNKNKKMELLEKIVTQIINEISSSFEVAVKVFVKDINNSTLFARESK